MSARVLQVNVSPGGVPKHPVAGAVHVGRFGLDGDAHRSATVHGGPHRAVCLLGTEAIRRVAGEGHPIAPGGAGENLTIEGLELASLPAGSRLAIGSSLVLELAEPAWPCSTIAANFADGRFGRISPKTHPADARMYARVLVEGEVRAGDAIAVLPPTGDRTITEERLARLDAADRKSMLAIWRAVEATGVDLRIVEDGELLLCCEPGRDGGPWNGGFGFTTLPHLVGRGLAHFRTHRASGWLELDPDDAGSPVSEPEDVRSVLAAIPGALRPADAEDVRVRVVGAEEAPLWGETLRRGLDGGTSIDWAAAAPFMAAFPGTSLLLAELGGAPVGAATLQIHRDAAWISGATVVPEARGRGVHRALIGERIRLGQAAGCDLFGADADPGSRSERNLQAAGLVVIGRRARWGSAVLESTAAGPAAAPTPI